MTFTLFYFVNTWRGKKCTSASGESPNQRLEHGQHWKNPLSEHGSWWEVPKEALPAGSPLQMLKPCPQDLKRMKGKTLRHVSYLGTLFYRFYQFDGIAFFRLFNLSISSRNYKSEKDLRKSHKWRPVRTALAGYFFHGSPSPRWSVSYGGCLQAYLSIPEW